VNLRKISPTEDLTDVVVVAIREYKVCFVNDERIYSRKRESLRKCVRRRFLSRVIDLTFDCKKDSALEGVATTISGWSDKKTLQYPVNSSSLNQPVQDKHTVVNVQSSRKQH
jgi:hypothetical protein